MNVTIMTISSTKKNDLK